MFELISTCALILIMCILPVCTNYVVYMITVSSAIDVFVHCI